MSFSRPKLMSYRLPTIQNKSTSLCKVKVTARNVQALAGFCFEGCISRFRKIKQRTVYATSSNTPVCRFLRTLSALKYRPFIAT
ncbi:hypothetical protein SAMN04487894_104164 [Niabella drilacis]|uniref:Uncharacterized protein n=1 Tax=Niabella drilacis (strain DSM 25811 / CCM 8410 / CCUG 62505 / LMG 26954 / E90) TaxID=1285928 RepID=A0A1G6PU53_NIADE|nr:hypothetical protein SAMN04487894_104164 [Niabella drilacis]